MRSSTPGLVTIAVGVIIAIAGLLAYPYANVWQRSMSGKAQLAEAEFNRQIKVLEAAAIKDSAQALADAEITRALGVAEANRIVADGLGGPEGYLRYLHIESLKEARAQGAQVIYVPTEAGLPILEASRLKPQQ
ncbi:membrane protease subunit [Pseudomonas aeruginosa]|nr:membrane protease subunit [Pseudomonas aeruginosa]